MKFYTIERGGRVTPGVALVDGRIRVCPAGVDDQPLWAPIQSQPIPLGARVEDGRVVEAPGVGAMLLLCNQAATFGSWHVRAAQPPERWDAMVAAESIPNALDRILAAERVRARYPHRAPVGWYEFARVNVTPEGARPQVFLYGYAEARASFEVRRRGRLDGEPSVLLVRCDDRSEVTVTDPRATAVARRGALAASGLAGRP